MPTSDENDISRTVPRRGLPREVPRLGAVIVVGAGDVLETLRKPRIVPMERLTLDIGRRPNPTPLPTATPTGAMLAIPDPTVSSFHARIQRASSGADLFIVQDLGSTNGTYVDGSARWARRRCATARCCSWARSARVPVVTATELEALEEDAARRSRRCRPVALPGGRPARSCAGWRAPDGEILIVGETGVGKEVLRDARSTRASGRTGQVRRHQLRCDPARAGRERAVRLREGRALDRRRGARPG